MIPYKKCIVSYFTFLELMVVLIIMSVIIAIAAPKLGNVYNTVKLDGSARQLKIFLTYARNTALAKRRNLRFFYWADKKEFTLKIQEDPVNNPEIYIHVFGMLSKVKLSSGINLVKAQKGGSLPVPPDTDFSDDIVPMGNKEEFWFTLQGSDGAKISVIVKAGSGIVQIKKGG